MQIGWMGRAGLVGLALIVVGCSDSNGAADVTPDASVDATVEALADTPDVPDAAPEAADAAPDLPRPTGPYEVPSGPVDVTFHAGPWLGTTTPTSVAVSWQTDESGDSLVEFGPDATYGGRAEGAPDATLHEVSVAGLLPETLYHYRACTGDTCTGDLTFATAPLPGRPLRFAVYGDTQDNTTAHAEVSESMRASLPALVLHVGDVVGFGADRESYVTEYFDPARRRNHYVPTFAAPGNHDWKDLASRIQNFRDYFAFPADPDVPLAEASYAFTYGDAFFIALSNTLDGAYFFFPMGGAKNPPLWDWLVAQASSDAARAARWRFAFFHYPPQSACQETWMPMQATRDDVLPLLQEHGFQAVFSGHTHEYEHQRYDRVHAFITGGGGGDTETGEACTDELPELVYRQPLYHHLTVDLGTEQATVRAVSTTGEVIDTVVLDRD